MGLFGGPNVQKIIEKGDIGELVKVFTKNNKDKVISEARAGLLSLGDTAIRPLLDAASAGDESCRKRTGAILREFPNGASDMLIEVLASGTKSQQIMAIEYVAGNGIQDPAGHILPLLESDDLDILLAATIALGEIGDMKAIPGLKDLARLGEKILKTTNGMLLPTKMFEALTSALYKLGSDAGIDGVIQFINADKFNLMTCERFGALLNTTTGQNLELYWDVETWNEWWSIRRSAEPAAPGASKAAPSPFTPNASTMESIIAFLRRQGFEISPNGPTSKTAEDPTRKRDGMVVIETGSGEIVFIAGYFTGNNARVPSNHSRFQHYLAMVNERAWTADFVGDPECNIGMTGSLKKGASPQEIVEFFAQWEADHRLLRKGLEGEYAGEYTFFMS